MVGAATFHAAMVEIVIGSLTLSTICTICCIQNSIKNKSHVRISFLLK